MRVKIRRDRLKGRGYPREKKIELPIWLNRYDVMYRVYYVLHELVHCMVGVEHNLMFMKVEDAILDIWDIKIVRRTVYPRMMYWNGMRIRNIPNKRGRRKRNA